MTSTQTGLLASDVLLQICSVHTLVLCTVHFLGMREEQPAMKIGAIKYFFMAILYDYFFSQAQDLDASSFLHLHVNEAMNIHPATISPYPC